CCSCSSSSARWRTGRKRSTRLRNRTGPSVRPCRRGRGPMMEMLWFCLAAAMITGYVILDGFDLGAGVVQLLVAKTEPEKAQVLRSIGPVWDGNEVWLVAAAGALFLAFPALYASSFSGFYLALMMVLWLLILRGIAIEFRNHLDNP